MPQTVSRTCDRPGIQHWRGHRGTRQGMAWRHTPQPRRTHARGCAVDAAAAGARHAPRRRTAGCVPCQPAARGPRPCERWGGAELAAALLKTHAHARSSRCAAPTARHGTQAGGQRQGGFLGDHGEEGGCQFKGLSGGVRGGGICARPPPARHAPKRSRRRRCAGGLAARDGGRAGAGRRRLSGGATQGGAESGGGATSRRPRSGALRGRMQAAAGADEPRQGAAL